MKYYRLEKKRISSNDFTVRLHTFYFKKDGSDWWVTGSKGLIWSDIHGMDAKRDGLTEISEDDIFVEML